MVSSTSELWTTGRHCMEESHVRSCEKECSPSFVLFSSYVVSCVLNPTYLMGQANANLFWHLEPGLAASCPFILH